MGSSLRSQWDSDQKKETVVEVSPAPQYFSDPVQKPESDHAAKQGFKKFPLSFRLFASLFLSILGMAYGVFLAQIWIDTGMQISLIAEGYRDFGFIELVSHSFQYLGWFAVVFAVLAGAFLLTSFSEKLKSFFIIWTCAWVISDIGATWLIRYHDFFAYQLFFSGVALAVSFSALFLLIQYDIWFKPNR